MHTPSISPLFPYTDALPISEFGFTLDVAAQPWNAKCLRYFTGDDDGLAQVWEGVCWCNPPYGKAIAAWIHKAYESAQQDRKSTRLNSSHVEISYAVFCLNEK